MGTRYFTPKFFAFMRELAANNDRAWFKANQDRFEEQVRTPALDFIDAFSDPLRKVSPHLVADPRKVGGSLFRIQRDTRFSKDKTPYKTGVGIQFRHVATQDDVHAPGLYLHLEPGACYAGSGLWRPSTENAYKIRQAIVEDPARWKRATRGKRFADVFSLREGETLKRAPKGIDQDHPLIDDLKMKDFIAGTALTQSQVTSGEFLELYTDLTRRAAPFLKVLCEAVGVRF